MSIESDLRTVLLTFDAVTALVGTGAAARIRPYALDERDSKTGQAIIIEVDTAEHANDLAGKGGMVTATVTLSCRAVTLTQARALAEAVRTNSTNPGTGLAGYSEDDPCIEAVLETESVGITPWDDGSTRAWFVVAQEYTIYTTETV